MCDSASWGRTVDAMLGQEFQALLQEGAPLLRRVENVNFRVRRDLAYQPAGN